MKRKKRRQREQLRLKKQLAAQQIKQVKETIAPSEPAIAVKEKNKPFLASFWD